MNKTVKTFAYILLVVGSNVISIFLVNSGQIDAALVTEITDKLIPIVLGTLTAAGAVLIKQKSMEAIVTNMVANGKSVFDRASMNVETVTDQSLKTTKIVGETNERLDRIEKRLDETANIKNSVDLLNKKFDIFFTNSPEAVKNGLARQIVEVGKDEN